MVAEKLAPLVVIVGQTASGKSDLGMFLAQKFNGEIICADSRTIYKGMDIGTAKPTKQDQDKVSHHLLDIVKPNERYSVARFKGDAQKALNTINKKGKLAIMVGGSGLYVDSVIFDYQFSDVGTPKDTNNPRHKSKEYSPVNKVLRKNTLILGLSPDKEVLNQRISNRVEEMIKQGFIDEVKELTNQYRVKDDSLPGIGYKIFAQYLKGEINLMQAKEAFIRGDKSLAKRQKTWFKRNKNINWVTTKEQAVELVTTLLNQ
jgi:tRNA dimethylallyltransferase